MTKSEFQLFIELKKEMEFSYQNVKFNLLYGKEKDGREYIKFGPLYEEKKYYSFGELMNEARVCNVFLKNYIEEL